MVNRYTQAPVATYNPMSMQELSFAPSFLRKRHDETNAAIQALNEQAGQYNVHNNFQNIAGQLVDPITQELTGLSSDLSQRGINESRGVDRLMQLNAKQKELFSPRGAIGQLQSRTQQFQEAKKELSDFFKNNPELANFKLGQANIGQATINPETGKLELGEMKIPSYVRHIADEDIMKQLNDAVKGLKPSDLARYGIQYTGSLGEFNDLFNVDKVKGVTPDRIQALLGSLVGPEIQQSVAQYGEMMGYTPEESLGMLNNRLIGISNASAYQDTDSRYFNVLDQRGVKSLNEEIPNLPFVVPGGSFESPVTHPFKDIKINDKDEVTSTAMNNPTAWEERGYNVITNQGDGKQYVYGPQGGNPIHVIDPNQKEEASLSAQEFLNYKNSIPELRNLSNKEALAKVDEYTKNLQTQYSNIVNPGDSRILKQLNESVLGSGGDITNRRVLGQLGGSGDFQEIMNQLGYKDYAEFEESKPQIHGYRLIPGQGVYYEAKVKDKNNKNIPSSIFIQADPYIENAFRKSSAISNVVTEGKITETAFEEQKYDQEGNPYNVYTTVINNPGTNKEPIVVESFDLLNQQDVLGLTPQQIISKYGKENIRIRSIKDVISEESNLVNNNLQNQF